MPNKTNAKNGSKKTSKNGSKNRVEGEGSYSATRAYNQNLGRALKDKGSIARGAERARRAVDGPEGPALRDAEKRAKSGPGKSKRAQSR